MYTKFPFFFFFFGVYLNTRKKKLRRNKTYSSSIYLQVELGLWWWTIPCGNGFNSPGFCFCKPICASIAFPKGMLENHFPSGSQKVPNVLNQISKCKSVIIFNLLSGQLDYSTRIHVTNNFANSSTPKQVVNRPEQPLTLRANWSKLPLDITKPTLKPLQCKFKLLKSILCVFFLKTKIHVQSIYKNLTWPHLSP